MLTEKQKKRFISKVLLVNDCLIWQGFANKTGYGIVTIDKYPYLVHRIAWVIAHGEKPVSRIYRTCGNKLCCRPSHLTLAEPEYLRAQHVGNAYRVTKAKYASARQSINTACERCGQLHNVYMHLVRPGVAMCAHDECFAQWQVTQ